MNYLEAQQELAESIMNAASKVEAYFWLLSGDEPNSLCRFLGIGEEELKKSLRLCKIYNGEKKDQFSKNNFEVTMAKAGCDWTTCRLNGTVQRFIKIGKEGHAVVPKDMYDADGSLAFYPVEDQHVRNMRTKSQRGAIAKLVNAANQKASEYGDESPAKERYKSKPLESPKELLFAYVQELVTAAGANGDGRLSQRSTRRLHRMILCCVDTAAKELLHASLEKYVNEKDNYVAGYKSLVSPERIHSLSGTVVTPDSTTEVIPPVVLAQAAIQDGNAIDIESGDDESTGTATTTDEFLSELKEEVLLQSLLHKRIHDKKERVFDLVHRNGRRLLVVLPPDTMSIATFEEEANRTEWIKTMLNSEERLDGMLFYLAKAFPDNYIRVGQTRKLSMRTVALNTGQTIALARVGRLNDFRMKKIRGFLKRVGQVNLQLSDKEQQRIDVQVGLHRTKEAIFGTYLHEWSRTKGKEKKPPEQVHYWNSNLAHEIEAEVDLYLMHLFLEAPDLTSPPVLNYQAGGFEKEGITVLFGGDHGDKHCPISCKLNLSSPYVRKEKKQLGYQCPVITFASVQCTKDAYDLMDNTVMPLIKQQLVDLQGSSLVVVYHQKNVSKAYRSYMVPSSIRPGTMAFLQETDQEAMDIDGDNNNRPIRMTFAYGGVNELSFGSISIDDPVFKDVPFFELHAKIIVTAFNELFIGDLAFLAMLIGMNNSSGAHCLMCMFKGSQFNCNHNSVTKRTKESLVQCLEEFMLANSHPTKKGPPNVKGVNGKGLWDIDPQRIIIPILHCPMGLVDKILESFKHWVNLEVEDFHDEITEGVRREYILAKQEHDAAVQVHQQAIQALAVVINTPEYTQAKVVEKEADKARIKARKAESKAKEQYDEQVQRHNAKKSSLNQQFEIIFRRNGVKREHYHGGKFNGVNCIRVMEQSKSLLLGHEDKPGFLQKCLESKHPTASEVAVRAVCKQYSRLLGLLDAIWSTIRGIDAGLLPTDAQKLMLQSALLEAKELWLDMKLTTLQPKWHLTFDGHLLEQFNKYGGLADKSDETIEKGHQTLKVLRDRFRGITSYEQKETCIRRELRRSRSPEIQGIIDTYEALIKQSTTTKRAADTVERVDSNKKAKQEKREAYIAH
jgi:hypothetical protein